MEMAWKKIPGLKGKLYVPEMASGEMKKHPCRECYACQQCCEERCRVCREGIGRDPNPEKSGKEIIPETLSDHLSGH